MKILPIANLVKTNPIQTQTNPISEMPKMSVNKVLTKDYENEPLWGINPIQTQSNPILKRMNVNVCGTRLRRAKSLCKFIRSVYTVGLAAEIWSTSYETFTADDAVPARPSTITAAIANTFEKRLHLIALLLGSGISHIALSRK